MNSRHAMGKHGRLRQFIAPTRPELFQGKTQDWINKNSRELIPGWFIDVNLSDEMKRKLLKSAVVASGLGWGSDVKVIW